MIVAASWRWDVKASIGRVRSLARDSVVVAGLLLLLDDMMSAWGLIHLAQRGNGGWIAASTPGGDDKHQEGSISILFAAFKTRIS